MNTNYRNVRATAQMRLLQNGEAREGTLTPEAILKVVNETIRFFGCTDVSAELVVADLEASFQTLIGAERVLVGDDDGYEPWLSKRKASINWRFWHRYEQYLLQEKGWGPATLEKLDETTDRILGLLTAPDRQGSWDRRGMVVGHVQSGKTANYIGLVCKAADAGYKLIIVLAGFHKSLRSQTQIRLEEGFLGYDRGASMRQMDGSVRPIGVGQIDLSPRADSLTTRENDGDFKRQVAQNVAINPGGNPLLFVIKKNGSVLRNLLNWVEWAGNATDASGNKFVQNVPLLVIDDEADQGSIDTKVGAIDEDGRPDEEHSPVILNQRIRRLLHLFDQSAYVGYTATPFANIFIHEKARTRLHGEDLFPRSFILALPTPSNHVGAARMFGYEDSDGNFIPGLPITRRVSDYADSLLPMEREGWMPPRHNKEHVPRYEGRDELPPSLREAIKAFILACAIRAGRGDITAHNSMLVHVTRYTNVQRRVADQIRRELRQLQLRLRHGEGDDPLPIIRELRTLWEDDFAPTTAEIDAPDCRPHNWGDIQSRLSEAAYSIQVREINGEAGEVLDYVNHEENGLNVIAVGGDKLSRGLTLEGLSISYFLRASRMYDTLMQMGRWFGYRPRYLDLCRLYTAPDLSEWFSHIASASEELREDFDRMAASGGTPRDYGLRVRSHPLMLVTSQVKMRHGTAIEVCFEGDISETINFWRDRDHLARNWDAATRLLNTVETTGTTPTHPGTSTTSWLWRNVNPDAVVAFLGDYQEHTASRKVKTKLLADYIQQEVQKNRLTSWTVLFASGNRPDTAKLGSATVQRVERSWHLRGVNDLEKSADKSELQGQNHFRIRRLVSPADELVDLTQEQQDRAFDMTVEAWRNDKDPQVAEPTRPGGRQIREVRAPENGLLLLYPIDPLDPRGGGSVTETEKISDSTGDIPILGFAISFPKVELSSASRVRYMVNNVYWEQEFGRQDLEEG